MELDKLKDRVIPTSQGNENETSDEIEGDEEPQSDSNDSISSLGDDVPQLRRSTRIRKPVQKLCLP